MSKQVLAYVRVSSKKQEDNDNSIPYQKRVISEYAQREGLQIIEWYEETHSAYKGKRGEFRRMLEALDQPGIDGVILHKLDRLSRNVGDFALVDKMMAKGKEFIVIEGRFDTRRAAGRLALRNLCNMCVWYSENLSEEITAKLGECLRRGYFPGPAPLGYRNGTSSDPDRKRKYPHPIQSPLVIEVFTLMASGNWSIRTAATHMRGRGMTNSAGSPITKSGLQRMLRNPFACGLVRWTPSSTGEPCLFKGNHESIVTKALFDKVQAVLDKRLAPSGTKRDHPYAKAVHCECGHYLIPSVHKGLAYMVCQNAKCRFTSIRESALEDHFVAALARLGTEPSFSKLAKEAALRLSETSAERLKANRINVDRRLTHVRSRLTKLNDAVLEGFFSPAEATAKKDELRSAEAQLLVEQADVQKQAADGTEPNSVTALLEGLRSLPVLYRSLNPLDRRRIALSLFTKRQMRPEGLHTEPQLAFTKMFEAEAATRTVRLLSDEATIASKELKQAHLAKATSSDPTHTEKVTSNRRSIAENAQKKPVSTGVGGGRSGEVSNGGAGGTGLEFVVERVRRLLDEAVLGLTEFLRSPDALGILDLLVIKSTES